MKAITILSVAIALTLLPGVASAQADPFKGDKKEKSDPNATRSIGILLEYFKVDHRTANQLISKYSPQATDARELRDELDKLIDGGKAELLETGWLQARSGQRSKTESIEEFIYATEYDPAEIPRAVGGAESSQSTETTKKRGDEETSTRTVVAEGADGQLPSIHMTPLTPTAFETRNMGLTIEVDPVLSNDNRTIDINLAPELVTKIADRQMAREGYEETAKGLEHVSMPIFYTMKVTTQISVIDGQYALLGIHTPHEDRDTRIISLIRADIIIVK